MDKTNEIHPRGPRKEFHQNIFVYLFMHLFKEYFASPLIMLT